MNTPRINPEDPKWTAYILGELDETERAEIERLLETSEEARALVEELTVATASLKEELATQTPLMMSPEQRAAIRTAAEPAPRRWFEAFPAKWGVGLAAAAVIVLAVVLPFSLSNKPGVGVPSATESEELTIPPEVNPGPSNPNTALSPAETAAGTVTSPQLGTTQQNEVEPAQPVGGTAAPVLTPEQFAALAQGGAPVTSKSSTSTSSPTSATPGRNGSLNGVVIDPSGALIPGVMIAATNTGTGVVANGVTNELGAYALPSLQPGTYQVTASLPGFQTRTITDLRLNSDDNFRLNFPMQVAAVATSVEVTVAADSVLQSSSSSVGEVLRADAVGNLEKTSPGVAAATPPPSAPNAGPTAGGGGRGARGGGGARAPQQEPRTAPGVGAGLAGGARQQGQQAAQGQGVQATRDGLSVADQRFSGIQAAPPPPPPAYPLDRVYIPAPNTEAYDRIVDNPFIRTTQENLATFSIDVDTASYANVRRFLNQNQLPPRDAVRIEELINYFNYDYAQPSGNSPIAPNMEVAAAPWNPGHRLVRIGIKAREVNAKRRPPSNLVFLIDVSGSMNSPEKLPLVKSGLNMLVEQLGENDSVSIVVYAGNSGLVLAPTSGIRKEVIRRAIDRLEPGGSTNGASGIMLAYNQATANFLRGGVNRVILMTDGDFNVGITNQGDLTRLIQDKAKSGVFLSVLGFGMGNIKDSTLEKLADQGNGSYAYIDNITEARKVLVEEMSGTLVTVAKDVKIQVDFNPARVEAYRLIGYENRVLRTEDFNNDRKDAGDMGAGHTVTALFEVVPKGGEVPGPSIDPSKYTQPQRAEADASRNAGSSSNEMLTLRVRYKLPDADTSTRMDVPLVDRGAAFARATPDFRFASAVAQFGMILRNSPYRGNASMEAVLDTAEGSRGQDRNGYRQEFITLVQRARSLGR